MPIYTYPLGTYDRLHAIGPATFDVSAYFTTTLQVAGGADFDGSANLGNASGDALGFYKDTGATQATTITDAVSSPTTCPWFMATENVAIMQSILNVLEGVGLVAT